MLPVSTLIHSYSQLTASGLVACIEIWRVSLRLHFQLPDFPPESNAEETAKGLPLIAQRVASFCYIFVNSLPFNASLFIFANKIKEKKEKKKSIEHRETKA